MKDISVHEKAWNKSEEVYDERGAYVSKQVRCIAYHLTSQASHICFADISGNNSSKAQFMNEDEKYGFLFIGIIVYKYKC